MGDTTGISIGAIVPYLFCLPYLLIRKPGYVARDRTDDSQGSDQRPKAELLNDTVSNDTVSCHRNLFTT